MLIAVAVYLLLTLVVGALLSSRVKTASDYLIAGRHLGLPLTTASLAAVQIGAGVVLGGAQTGAASGVWPGMWYGLGCGAGLVLAGLVAAKRLRESGGIVPIDFFAQRYGERRWVRLWAWVSNIPSLLGIFAAQLMACGAILEGLGIPFRYGVIGIPTMMIETWMKSTTTTPHIPLIALERRITAPIPMTPYRNGIPSPSRIAPHAIS